MRIGFGHRKHTLVLAATRSCPERGTSDGLSSRASPGLMLRRTALRGASAGLRPSACATSASRRRSPFRAIRPIELAPRTNTARNRGIYKYGPPSNRLGFPKKTFRALPPCASSNSRAPILVLFVADSLIPDTMLVIPSLLGSSFMPGASLSLGRSSASAPAPVVMAVASKKVSVGVIGTGLVGAELLEQV